MAIRDDLIEPEPWTDVKGNTVVPRGKRRIQKLDGVKTFNFDWPPQKVVTTRLRDILESDVDEKYYLDEEKTAKLVAQLEEKDKIVGTVTLSASDWRGLNRNQNQTAIIETMGGGHREPKIAVEQFTKGAGISCCIDANYTNGIAPGDVGKGRRTHVVEEVRPVLTPDRVEKRQNGRRFKDDGEESFTLTAQDRHGVAVGDYPRYRIRKLTPLECWRLQGFPDESHEAVKNAGISDSQRYKQAGNAVTVNVVEAIGERLIPMLNEFA